MISDRVSRPTQPDGLFVSSSMTAFMAFSLVHLVILETGGVCFVMVWLGARAILILAFPAVIPEWVGNDPFLANFGVDVDLAGEAFFYFGAGVLHTAAAVGLLRLRGWARWLAIGIAAPPALVFLLQPSLQPCPVVFIVGVLIIWYLLTDKAKQVFSVAEDVGSR